jgi:hypothetical protein
MKTRSLIALLASFSVLAGPGVLPARADDAELAEGIRQAQQGEFDTAAVTLDRAARRLAAAKAPGTEIARAYVYLAVAQVGLSQEAKAKTSFVEARRQDPSLRLDAKEFPPRIVQAYEAALREAGLSVPPPPPAPATAEKKGGGSKALWVVLGAGAAAGGAAIALGGGGSDPSAQPTPPPIPQVAGRWVGDGSSDGQIFTAGGCNQQNSVVLQLTQSGGTFSGNGDFRVLRASCSPENVGATVRHEVAGTIDNQGNVTIRFPSGPYPNELWSGSVNGAGTRMQGTITGIPNIGSGTWAVNKQ